MFVYLVCPRGHRFESETDVDPSTPASRICPICGERAEPSTGGAPVAPTEPLVGDESTSGVGNESARPRAGSELSSTRFTRLRHYAQGGLGKISVARDEQLNRQVALKEIRPEFAADGECRRRFLIEAEITGQLEHPGIVPVYALGHDDRGEPYYAMRLIQGRTLGDAIAEYHQAPETLKFRDLLSRFVDVCQTMAYAHGQNVIHRDLKPSNIMLGNYGETLVVDWGLAKRSAEPGVAAEPSRETDGSAYVDGADAPPVSAESPVGDATKPGRVLGTPSYMSPEQASGQVEALTPGIDIYSLGAVLYSILCGKAPFAGSSADVVKRVQSNRFPPPRSVNSRASPALEAICLKAMSGRVEDRYTTAAELATDVERWLADEPVSGFREPWSHRAGRWVKRHRLLVTGVVALLLAAVPLSIMLAVNRERARRRAESDTAQIRAQQQLAQANENRALAAADAARQEAVKALAIKKFFLEDMLEEAMPERSPVGDQITVREVLDRTAGNIDRAFQDTPQIAASVRSTLGNAYRSLGLDGVAESHLRVALDLYRQELGPDNPESLTAMSNLALALGEQGKLDEAIALMRNNLDGRRRAAGEEDPATLTAMSNLALLLKYDHQLEEAERLYLRMLEIRRRIQSSAHPDLLTAANNLANVLETRGELEAAEELMREAFDGRRLVLGPEHPNTISSMHNLAVILQRQGRWEDAEKLYREALEIRRRVQGPRHPHTLEEMNSLAVLLQMMNQLEEAETLYRQSLENRLAIFGPEHQQTLMVMNNLAMVLLDQGKLAEADPMFRETLRLGRKRFPEAHPFPAYCLLGLGRALTEQDQAAAAEPFLREALEICRESLPPGFWVTAQTENILGSCLGKQGRHAEAEQLLVQGYEGMTAAQGTPAFRLAQAGERIIEYYEDENRPEDAGEWRRKLSDGR